MIWEGDSSYMETCQYFLYISVINSETWNYWYLSVLPIWDIEKIRNLNVAGFSLLQCNVNNCVAQLTAWKSPNIPEQLQHCGRRAGHSDWYENSFTIVVYEEKNFSHALDRKFWLNFNKMFS